jgi:hypothetical protein
MAAFGTPAGGSLIWWKVPGKTQTFRSFPQQ